MPVLQYTLHSTSNISLLNTGGVGRLLSLAFALWLLLIISSRRRHFTSLLVSLLLLRLLVLRFTLGARAAGRRWRARTRARWAAVRVRAGTRRAARRSSLLFTSSYEHDHKYYVQGTLKDRLPGQMRGWTIRDNVSSYLRVTEALEVSYQMTQTIIMDANDWERSEYTQHRHSDLSQWFAFMTVWVGQEDASDSVTLR